MGDKVTFAFSDPPKQRGLELETYEMGGEFYKDGRLIDQVNYSVLNEN